MHDFPSCSATRHLSPRGALEFSSRSPGFLFDRQLVGRGLSAPFHPCGPGQERTRCARQVSRRSAMSDPTPNRNQEAETSPNDQAPPTLATASPSQAGPDAPSAAVRLLKLIYNHNPFYLISV